MRFVFIKEVVDVDAAVGGGDRVTLKDMLTVIKSNKYIWIVSLIYLFAALFSSIGAITYYCIVTFGDTAMAGTLSIFNIIPMVTMAFYPLLMKKLSVKQLIMIMLLFNIPVLHCKRKFWNAGIGNCFYGNCFSSAELYGQSDGY